MAATQTELTQLCQTLLEDIRTQASGAWERMLDEFGPMVLAAAHRTGLRGADAEDVFQSTWMALHRSVARIREPAALAAWVAVTARREAIRVWTRRPTTIDPDSIAEQDQPEQNEPEPLDTLASLELRGQVHDGLEMLDVRCRELLVKLFFSPESPSYNDISAALGMRVGSVGPTRLRCLAKLATILERLRLEGPG
ncbi:MAG: sigma-70 family RNA polymerase sigma factor [Planctomycetota bacterium]|nr:MAG: sigma-70 family RNA polymerase sigma factor [Planctomycetota bacterium]